MPMFEMTAGMFNFFWSGGAMIALWLLYRIYQIVKALHHIELSRYERERPDVFED